MRQLRSPTLRLAAIVATLTLCMAAMPPGSAQDGPPPAAPLRVAVFVESPPFSSTNAAGHVVGIIPDFIQLVGIRAGRDFVIVPKTTVADLVASALAGEADVVAGLSETPERAEAFDFSEGFIWAQTELWTKTGAALPADMAGKRIAVIAGGAGVGLANASFPLARVIAVENITSGLRAVERGDADAIIGGVPVVARALRDEGIDDIAPMGPPLATSVSRFAVAKGNAALLATLDDALAAIPADERTAVYLKWAGADLSAPAPPRGWLSGEGLTLLGATLGVLAFLAAWALLLRRQVGLRTRALAAANAQLQKSADEKAQLAAIVEGNDDAIVSLDLKGTVRSWNRGAQRLLGLAAAEAVGRNFADLMPIGHQNLPATLQHRVASGERVETYETQYQRGDGGRVDVSVSLTPLRDAGGAVVGAALVARDVSDRRKLEEMRRRAGSPPG
jgi:PAS domain S-box-containing protein